jgi:hypothetical protein
MKQEIDNKNNVNINKKIDENSILLNESFNKNNNNNETKYTNNIDKNR